MEEFVDKHNRRLKQAVEDIRTGVEKVSVSPTQLAARKADKMLAKLTERVKDGTWAARLQKVSLEDWRRKMVEKGIPRIPGGIDAAADKVRDFASQLLPYIDSGLGKIRSMPDMTIEDAVNRAATWIRYMSAFKKK